jgi:uncharacterized repeat protein (TIGR03837 family)
MAPAGEPGVDVIAWTPAAAGAAEPADVVVEAFGCALDDSFVAAMARRAQAGRAPAWINLEYLSAEPWVPRHHGLASPVLSGPGAGLRKFFFYPGFTPGTGGLLREDDLAERQAALDREAWLVSHGVRRADGPVVSLFCYEPPALTELFHALGPHAQVLVTSGRATAAARAALAGLDAPPRTTWLRYLTQPGYDALLSACDLNFVRGEDSLVRALWAGRAFVWQIYPQDDNAHHAKLDAFLDWMEAPAALRAFHRIWNGIDAGPLPAIDTSAWQQAAMRARARLWAQPDLATQLQAFVASHFTAAPAPNPHA